MPIALGRVIDAWGVKGWVKVEPYAAASDTTLTQAKRWHLSRSPRRPMPFGPRPDPGPADPPGASGLHGTDPHDTKTPQAWVGIERARRHSAGVVAKLSGVDDREAALAWRGAEVGVLRTDFPALAEGEFYWVDLIGCELSNAEGQALGKVVSIEDHGAHPLLQTDTGVMVPFVDQYLIEVLPQAQRIVVDWQADWSR